MEITGVVTKKKYKIRALTFGERNEILDEISLGDSETGKVKIRPGLARIMYIERGVVSPKLDKKQINALPEAEGNQLYNAILGLTKAPLESSPQQSSFTKENE